MHPNLEYMMDLEDADNTNIEEENPLKCHLNEFWTNTTANSAIYSFYWYKASEVSTNILKVNNKYITNVVGIDQEPEFSCSLGMNTSFARTYIGVLIKQNWDPIGIQYNYSTRGFDFQNYDSIDDAYYPDSTATTEADTEATTMSIPSTTTPRWDTIDNKEYSEPYPIKYGLPPLPKPWGNLCPNSRWERVKKLGLPDNNTVN